MTDAVRRPPEAVRGVLEGAVELLQGEQVTIRAVLVQLARATEVADGDHLLIGQLELAIADVAHWSIRCGQVGERLAALAGVGFKPGIEWEHASWADSSHSPASPR